MILKIVFGNKKNRRPQLSIGDGEPCRILANVGHMDMNLPINDEKEKVRICVNHGVDIIADNSVTKEAYEFRSWILENYSVKLNTVPIYECYDFMCEGSFNSDILLNVIEKHINTGADMVVVHPALITELVKKLNKSNRIMPLTSRGGAQLFWYMNKYGKQNPYFECWNEICDIVKGTGVALAMGLSLRAGSVCDEIDDVYLYEMDIMGELIKSALDKQIPVVIEGVGHVTLKTIPLLLSEIKNRCHDIPIKTLGPLASDRSMGMDHITALLSATVAALNGASIIGALFRSEHLGLPTINDFKESLANFRLLNYLVNMTSSEPFLSMENKMGKARAKMNWDEMFKLALYPELAKNIYCERNNELPKLGDECSMCGNRCAVKLVDMGKKHVE